MSVAELYLGDLETLFLDACPLNIRPVLYKRYVDDILLIFDLKRFNRSARQCKDSYKGLVREFLDYVHEFLKDTRIVFTSELEVNRNLPFLDCNINRTDYYCDISVYRKPTNSNRFVSPLSFVSKQVLVTTLNALRLRALRYCTSGDCLKEEFDFLKDVFIRKLGHCKNLVEKFFTISGSVQTCRPPYKNPSHI